MQGNTCTFTCFIYSVQSQNQVSTVVFAFYLIFHLSWQKIKKVKWFARDHKMSQNLEPRLNAGHQCTGLAYSVNHTSSSCFPSSHEQNMRKFVENLSKAENHPAAGCLWWNAGFKVGINQYLQLCASWYCTFHFLSPSNICLIQEIGKGFFKIFLSHVISEDRNKQKESISPQNISCSYWSSCFYHLVVDGEAASLLGKITVEEKPNLDEF